VIALSWKQKEEIIFILLCSRKVGQCVEVKQRRRRRLFATADRTMSAVEAIVMLSVRQNSKFAWSSLELRRQWKRSVKEVSSRDKPPTMQLVYLRYLWYVPTPFVQYSDVAVTDRRQLQVRTSSHNAPISYLLTLQAPP